MTYIEKMLGLGAIILALAGCSDTEPEVKANSLRINPTNISIIHDGDEARIPKWQWVRAVNSEPVPRNGLSELVAGETCGVETGGTIDVLGFTKEGEVLVEYAAPGNTGGTQCPSGTQYLIQPEEFVGLTAGYNAKIRAAGELKEDLQSILEGKSVEQRLVNGKFVKVGDKFPISKWEWVDVMNLSPVVQQYRNGSIELGFQDSGDRETCGVKAGGIIEVLGFTRDGRALVEYSVPGNPLGTQCPDGTQYLVQPEKLVGLDK